MPDTHTMDMDTQQAPQPSPQAVIRALQQELNRTNDNRIYLLALLEETREEAIRELGNRDEEIVRLNGIVSQLMGLVPEDQQEAAEKIVRATTQQK